MKKLPVVHLAWLLAAIASFVLGSQFFPARSNAERDQVDAKNAGGGLRGAGSGGSGTSEGWGTRANGAGRAGGGATANGARVVLSDREVVALGEEFRKATSPIDRRLAFSRLLEGLTAENAELIREQIAHLHHHSAEFREFHYAWGAVAGAQAVAFGIDTEKDDMSPALAGWASADPQAALAWFEALDLENDSTFDPLLKGRELTADGLRSHLLRGLVYGLADSDPAAASEFVLRMAEGGSGQARGLMHVVMESVLRRAEDPKEAVEWSEGLPAGDLRNDAFQRVAGHYARRDTEAATAWAESYAGEPEGPGVVRAVAGHWASQDPQGAAGWVSELPAGEGQNAGMAHVMAHWAGRDPGEAGTYLQALSDSPLRDAAVSGYSRKVVWEDPGAAMDWATTITDDERRRETVIQVARAWRHEDAAAAAEWLASSGLPPETQETILSAPRRGRKGDW